MEEPLLEIHLECGDTVSSKVEPRIGAYRFCIHCDSKKKVIGTVLGTILPKPKAAKRPQMDLETKAREMFPEAYAAITDDNPMPDELIRAVKAALAHDCMYIVVCVKANCVAPSETQVESFAFTSQEEADRFALALSDNIQAEWMFYSQFPSADVPVEQAVQYLLNLGA